MKSYAMKAEVQLYPTQAAAWHLLYLPSKEAGLIRKGFKAKEKGWSSLPVEVQVRKTKWRTSIFYDRRSDSYILPLKAEIRRKEGLMQGDIVFFKLKIGA
jgi:hypothetical protein